MEAVVFMGIQGSGKSSFFRERFFSTHFHISLDLLKTRNREQCGWDDVVGDVDSGEEVFSLLNNLYWADIHPKS